MPAANGLPDRGIAQAAEQAGPAGVETTSHRFDGHAMHATWIVAANAGRARFFSQAVPAARLDEVGDMADTAGRLGASETESDRISPTAGSGSRHGAGAAIPGKTYQPAQSPEAHAALAFARDIASHLLQARRDERYSHLVIAAAPAFLGVLRKCLDPLVLAAVSREIDKDYTRASPGELQELIGDALP